MSVVTPVYNAERFIRRSVEASVSQEEVGEVLLIEDASPDNSLEVCRALAREYPKVRLLQHPDGKNHGPGATRNLGLQEARCAYVAFADADNYYLPGRFVRDREILLADPTVEGVYSAEGIDYDTERARETFLATAEGDSEFLTLSEPVPPEELVYVWLSQHPTATGEFGMDAITVRRSVFEKTGVFDPSLRLQQDHHLFVRLAALCRLVPGVLDRAVCVRGVHENQRMTNVALQNQCTQMRLEKLRPWFFAHVTDPAVLRAFERTYWSYQLSQKAGLAALYPLLRTARAYGRRAWTEPYGIVDQGLLRVTGDRGAVQRLLSLKRRLVSGDGVAETSR